MATIGVVAENEIKAFLAGWWKAVNQQVEAATGSEIQIGKDAPLDLLLASEIGQRLVRIAAAADNQTPWSPQNAQAILVDCDSFEAWLNQSTTIHHTPEEFWNTPVGHMVLRARLWAGQDQLISLKDAAELTGLSLSSLSQRISRGQIKFYRDPLEPNPQRARRIRMTDLEQFVLEGIVRKPGIPLFSKFSLPLQTLSQNRYQLHQQNNKAEKNSP